MGQPDVDSSAQSGHRQAYVPRISVILAPRPDPARPLLEYAVSAVRALEAAGWDVEPVVFGPSGGALHRAWRRAAGRPVFPADLKHRVRDALPSARYVPFVPRPGRSLRSAAEAVAKVLRPHPPAALMGSLLDEAGFVAAAVGRRLHRPAAVVAHGSDVERWMERPRSPSALRSGQALRFSSAVVAVSQALAAPLRSVGLQVAHIPFTVFAADFPSGPVAEDPRDLRLLFVGRVGPAKGFDVACGLLEVLPHARLTAVGPTEPGYEIPRHPRLRWVGAVEQSSLPTLFREHHLLVHPSRSEGLGNVLVESLLVGRPAVARRVGGIPEVVTPKVGALVDGDDLDAWAQAVTAVRGRQLRGELTPARLRQAALPLTWENQGPRLAALLRRIIP